MYISSHGVTISAQWYQRFYPGIECFILPMSYCLGCYVIGCIGTDTHCQVLLNHHFMSHFSVFRYFLKKKRQQQHMRHVMVSKNKCLRVGYKNSSLVITICHHSSLVMLNGDPGEGFLYPTLTLLIDSETLAIVEMTLIG